MKSFYKSSANILQASPCDVHLRFIIYAQFLCLRCKNDQDYKNILALDKQYWFPIIYTDKKYWLDLSSEPIFTDVELRRVELELM